MDLSTRAATARWCRNARVSERRAARLTHRVDLEAVLTVSVDGKRKRSRPCAMRAPAPHIGDDTHHGPPLDSRAANIIRAL